MAGATVYVAALVWRVSRASPSLRSLVERRSDRGTIGKAAWNVPALARKAADQQPRCPQFGLVLRPGSSTLDSLVGTGPQSVPTRWRSPTYTIRATAIRATSTSHVVGSRKTSITIVASSPRMGAIG